MNEIHNASNYGDDERPFDISSLLDKFLRRKKLFIYITLPLFFIILTYKLTRPYSPIYRATFDIGVAREAGTAGLFSSLGSETSMGLMGTVTQRVIRNLLSVKLAEKVVDSLDLYVHVKNGKSDIKVKAIIKEDFVTPIGPLKLQVTPRISTQDDTSGGSFKIFKDGDKIMEGKLNEYVDFDFFKLKIISLSRKDFNGGTYYVTIYPRDRIALSLRNSLSIKVLEADRIEKVGGVSVPFSGEGVSRRLVSAKTIFPGMSLIGIVRIDVLWGNPADALEIAKVLSRQVLREDISEKSLQFIQSKAFIDSQLVFYQNKLLTVEEEIRDYKKTKRIVNLKASSLALINQVSELESKRNQLLVEEEILWDLSDYLAVGEEGVGITLGYATTMVSDPILQNLYSQLLMVEAALRGKLKEYSEGHPKVLATKAELEGLKEQMKEEVAKRIPTIKSQIQSITKQIYAIQAKLKNVPDDEIQLVRFERDRETAEKLYTFFAEKLEETRVREAGITSDVKIINPAVVSSSPINSSPVNSKGIRGNFVMALLLSVIAGSLAVYIAEYMDTTIKSPEIIKAKIGLPVFASIPVVEKENKDRYEIRKTKNVFTKISLLSKYIIEQIKRGISRYKNNKTDEAVKLLDPNINSTEFEAFRKLAVNLAFVDPEKKYQVIYFTSTTPEEGKTFVVINLGFVLGRANRKVIIVDTDFRKKRGRVTDITRLKNNVGLFEILKGEARLKDTIIPFNTPEAKDDSLGSSTPKHPGFSVPEYSHSTPGTRHAVVDLLPIGDVPPNPFVFLESPKMKTLITELKKMYEYIIIDGVPLLLFADASLLANFADGVLLTVRYGKINCKDLEQSKEILSSAKSNIIGIVMNGVAKTRGSYYYRYHHKYYSKYYKKGD